MRAAYLGGKSCPNSADLSNSPFCPPISAPHSAEYPYRGYIRMGFRFRSNDERSYFLAHFGVTANTNIRARCVLVAVVAAGSKKFVAMKFNLDFKSDFLDTFPISSKRRFPAMKNYFLQLRDLYLRSEPLKRRYCIEIKLSKIC